MNSSFLHPSISICSFFRSCWFSPSPLCCLLPPLHSPAFLISFFLCLQWRHLLGPSTLLSPESIFLILIWVALQISLSNLWKRICPFRVSSEGRINSSGGQRRSLIACVGAQMALGSNPCSFTYHLWDIGLLHFLIHEMRTKTDPRVEPDCF